MGGEERSGGVGIFVAEKLVDSVVSVERHCKRVLILKMVLEDNDIPGDIPGAAAPVL